MPHQEGHTQHATAVMYCALHQLQNGSVTLPVLQADAARPNNTDNRQAATFMVGVYTTDTDMWSAFSKQSSQPQPTQP